MHENQMHAVSSFVTLTYAPENLPYQSSLHYPDFKRFLRRVRVRKGPFRYFMAGEYGDEHDRPHYHALLFGLSFPDRKFFKKSGSGFDLYTSASLSSLWPHGHASVGDVSFESAGYVARYVVKKAGGPDEDRLLRFDEYGVCYWLTPEFMRCSLKPAIGKAWWIKFGKEVLARGNVVMRGQEMKVPRYYGKLCSDPAFDWVESQAAELARPEDQTPERLRVREEVAEARLRFKKRTLV